MIKAIIFDYFGVLYNPGTELLDQRVFDLIIIMKQKYKMILCSNVSQGYKHHGFNLIRDKGELFDLFAISGDIGYSKPDVGVFKYVCSQLDVRPEECILIDDSQINCEGAEHAGMQAILFKDFKSFKNDLVSILM